MWLSLRLASVANTTSLTSFRIYTVFDKQPAFYDYLINKFDFRNPVACGITSLGLDHCSILGHTYDEIAWQKSGIFKESCIAFTVDQTNESTFKVMRNRASELKVSYLS